MAVEEADLSWRNYSIPKEMGRCGEGTGKKLANDNTGKNIKSASNNVL
jgi:hypothetical protein